MNSIKLLSEGIYRWSSYNSVTQTVPRKYNSICIKIFHSICIAAGLKQFTTVATGYTYT